MAAPETSQQEQYIAIWAKAVETQMHFNEMSVKSRQLGLTFVAAAMGVAVVLLSKGEEFAFSIPIAGIKFQLHISIVLLLGASLALFAVRGLDLNVYHKMLRGAVTFGEDFEENYMKKIFKLEKGMTQAISHFSRFSDAKVETTRSGNYRYLGDQRVSAEDKIRTFYRSTIIFLCAAAVALLFVTNASPIGQLISTKNSSAKTSTPAIQLNKEQPK